MIRLVLVALATLFWIAAPARAGASERSARAGSMEVETAWARASIGVQRPAAAYATIRNTGERTDRLTRIETPRARSAEVHETIEQDGRATMRQVETLEVPPGEEVRLAPGGIHIMLMQLTEPLKEGGKVPLTFVFERAGAVTIEAEIAGVAASKPPG